MAVGGSLRSSLGKSLGDTPLVELLRALKLGEKLGALVGKSLEILLVESLAVSCM